MKRAAKEAAQRFERQNSDALKQSQEEQMLPTKITMADVIQRGEENLQRLASRCAETERELLMLRNETLGDPYVKNLVQESFNGPVPRSHEVTSGNSFDLTDFDRIKAHYKGRKLNDLDRISLMYLDIYEEEGELVDYIPHLETPQFNETGSAAQHGSLTEDMLRNRIDANDYVPVECDCKTSECDCTESEYYEELDIGAWQEANLGNQVDVPQIDVDPLEIREAGADDVRGSSGEATSTASKPEEHSSPRHIDQSVHAFSGVIEKDVVSMSHYDDETKVAPCPSSGVESPVSDSSSTNQTDDEAIQTLSIFRKCKKVTSLLKAFVTKIRNIFANVLRKLPRAQLRNLISVMVRVIRSTLRHAMG